MQEKKKPKHFYLGFKAIALGARLCVCDRVKLLTR